MPRPSAPARKKKQQSQHLAGHDHLPDDIDGCSFTFSESEATPDADLPPCKGGVEERKARRK